MRVTSGTKGKKCDYCDDYAVLKFKEQDLYTYLCEWCFKNPNQSKRVD